MTDLKRRLPWPDDGGLREPVRRFGEGGSVFDLIRKHFAPKPPAA